MKKNNVKSLMLFVNPKQVRKLNVIIFKGLFRLNVFVKSHCQKNFIQEDRDFGMFGVLVKIMVPKNIAKKKKLEYLIKLGQKTEILKKNLKKNIKNKNKMDQQFQQNFIWIIIHYKN